MVKTLWKRAPAWRLSCMMAGLCTISFVCFPPQKTSPLDHLADNFPPPSYTRQPATKAAAAATTPPDPQEKTAPAGQNTTPVAKTAGTATPRVPASNPPASQPVPQPTPLPKAAAPVPQTASLSLAVASGTDTAKNGTGLDQAQTGHLYSDSILAGGYNIPLPAGKWALLAHGELRNKANAVLGAIYYLGQIEHKKLMGSAIIYTAQDPSGSITADAPLKVSPGCNRSDAVYVFKKYADGSNPLPNCWYEYAYFTDDLRRWADRAVKMNGITRAAAGDLAAKGVEIPQDMMTINFELTEKTGLLYADFKFAPEQDGISSTIAPTFVDSDWAPPNIGRFPEKVAFRNKIKAWGDSFYPRFNDAFTKGLPPQTAAAPEPAASAHGG